jgi:hypothetical protein
MTKKIKDEYMPGGARRQEMLDKAVDYLRTPRRNTTNQT